MRDKQQKLSDQAHQSKVTKIKLLNRKNLPAVPQFEKVDLQKKTKLARQINALASEERRVEDYYKSLGDYQQDAATEAQRREDEGLEWGDENGGDDSDVYGSETSSVDVDDIYPNFDSEIVATEEMKRQILDQITVNPGGSEATLLYRATQHGWSAENFHEFCDDSGSTLTIAKTADGRVFGGFTDIPWKSTSELRRVPGAGNSFLFCIDERGSLHKFKCLRPEHEVYHALYLFPVFGDGHFLYLEGRTGSCYTHSNAYETAKVGDPNTFLAGSKNFQVVELEVYFIFPKGGAEMSRFVGAMTKKRSRMPDWYVPPGQLKALQEEVVQQVVNSKE